MKTNVVMESCDRDLFGIVIRQRTKDHFMSISDLQKAYDVARIDYGWAEQNITSIMQTKTFKERLFYILENTGVIKLDISSFMENVKDGVVGYLKAIGVYKTTGARDTKMVMCNPYIWVLIALELNPMIYAKVIMWLTDTLIFDRIEACDEFIPMNASVKRVVSNPDYALIAIEMNKRVFGKHMRGIRDLASKEQLKLIAKIEEHIGRLLDRGYINTMDQVVKEIKEFVTK